MCAVCIYFTDTTLSSAMCSPPMKRQTSNASKQLLQWAQHKTRFYDVRRSMCAMFVYNSKLYTVQSEKRPIWSGFNVHIYVMYTVWVEVLMVNVRHLTAWRQYFKLLKNFIG